MASRVTILIIERLFSYFIARLCSLGPYIWAKFHSRVEPKRDFKFTWTDAAIVSQALHDIKCPWYYVIKSMCVMVMWSWQKGPKTLLGYFHCE